MEKEKRKVLLVDDESGIRRILRIFLEVEGFQVLEAVNANQAYQVIDEEKPDVVILDVILFGTTGFEICEKIKGNPVTRGIYVILFTALTKDSDVAEGERVGADLYLMKPLNPKDIVERVKAVFSEKA
jgi:two-component system, OmpR family, phosphate regulon response regulator PhoB